jgi:hypothetical protein
MRELFQDEAIFGREPGIANPGHAARAARSPGAMTIVDVFRKLAEFRKDYDESVLSDVVAMLCQHMSAADADALLSDAFVMDNELRFRRPGGVMLHASGDLSLSRDEIILAGLIAASDSGDDRRAIAMAKRLGVENNRGLRQAACVLARDLARASINVNPPKAKWPIASPVEWHSGFEMPP